MAAVSNYNKKAENKAEKSRDRRIFVVHEHNAKHLHWDFRIEKGNVLKSWAIPKEPDVVDGEKRLAIMVDDHNLDYAGFEGEIKRGYGKGTVKIWDKGYYEIESEKKDKIVMHIYGKRLRGEYVLLRFEKAGKNAWLFFRKKSKSKRDDGKGV